MRVCLKCGKENRPDACFCRYCGEALPQSQSTGPDAAADGSPVQREATEHCPRCGCSIQPSEAFCKGCGAKARQNSPQPETAPSTVSAPPPLPGSLPQNAATGRAKKRSGILLLVVAIVGIVLAVVAVAGVFVYRHLAHRGGDTSVAATSTPPQITAAPTPTPMEAAPTPTAPPALDDEYLFPQSDRAYLTDSDVHGLAQRELALAWYEIYARHGCRFAESDIQRYFDGKSWYTGTIPPQVFQDAVFNGFERENLRLLNPHTPTPTLPPLPVDGDYMFAESSHRYLSNADLAGLTKDQLRIARNEIYARHGRRFAAADLQQYFDAKSWYRGTISPEAFQESVLNEFEKYNTQLILQYEGTLP